MDKKNKDGIEIVDIEIQPKTLKKRDEKLSLSNLIHSDLQKSIRPKALDLIEKQQSQYAKLMCNNKALEAIQSLNNSANLTVELASKYQMPSYSDQIQHYFASHENVAKQMAEMTSIQSSIAKKIANQEVLNLNSRLSDSLLSSFKESFAASESMQRALNNDALSYAKKLQEQSKSIFNSHATIDLNKQHTSLGKLLNNSALEFAKKESRRLQEIFNSPLRNMDKLASQVLGHSFAKSAMESACLRSKVFNDVIDANTFAKSFSIETSIKATTLAALDSASKIYADFGKIEEDKLQEYRARLKLQDDSNTNQSNVSLIECFAILLAILLHLHSLTLTDQSSKDIENKIDNLETNIVSQIYVLNSQVQELQDSSSNDDFDKVVYVVLRPVNLRTQSNTNRDSNIMAVLKPNQKVELLKRNGKWIYVGYFDYVEDIPKTGWVYKKNLKMIR